MKILKSWTRETDDGRVDALEISDGKVYVASYEDEDVSAVGCSWAEFSAGKLNEVARDVFGKAVLDQALHFVQRLH